MKKILIVALVALFIAGAVGVGFAVTASGPGKPGDIMGMDTGRYASDPHRTFRLVRYAPTGALLTTLTQDSLVIWDSTAINGDDGVTITTTTTSGDTRVAGVLVTAINSGDVTAQVRYASDDVGKKNWGWLQTYGLANVNVASTSGAPTAGYALGTGIIAGSAGIFSSDAVGQPNFLPAKSGNAGFFYDDGTQFAKYASDADQSVKVFLKCE